MSSAGPLEWKELLIASVTPQNLERGVLWFSENLTSIKKARVSNPWWRDNTFIIEKDLVMKPAEFSRRLMDLGYERAQSVLGKGLFAVRGGIIEVWPINTEGPYIIEFSGNSIASITGVVYKFPPHNGEEGMPSALPTSRMGEELRLRPGSYVVHADHGIGIFRGVVSENSDSENLESPNQSKLGMGQARIKNLVDDAKNTKFHLNSKFYAIEYAPPARGRQPDMLYVPVDQKNRLSPYVGFTTPTIHRLGGTVWFKTKKKAREDAEKFAKELWELYTRRHRAVREPYPPDETLERQLKETFAFQETEGQIRAEEEIKKDLSRDIPMDRILCGDVGFGKTEVAIRAALRVIASGKQVAVLAPTTVLAAQHEKTFRERLGKRLPVIISMLSRLTPRQDEKRILRELAEGKIDCIIGTHRLLSQDVQFKNLGLVIIDEEQRFGVKQKERFKEMRSEIDILSLSATPIPRTLSLALAKLRDISLIETPPPERLPIKTIVLPYSLKIIRNAIQYELSRGGQIYFLHNRIETIEKVKEKILKALQKTPRRAPPKKEDKEEFRTLSPDPYHLIPRIGIIHGRMKEKEIIRVMNQFRSGEIKILLATTIIENGLDISNANTLIVDDAARLGLAEAHQLRGRIGRGPQQAFAYFLYKPRSLPIRGDRKGEGRASPLLRTNHQPSPFRPKGRDQGEEKDKNRALERLEALKEYSDLGSGYQIALRDLEIRGAGNILGKEQSGTINKVGLNLYCQMLAEATELLK